MYTLKTLKLGIQLKRLKVEKHGNFDGSRSHRTSQETKEIYQPRKNEEGF